MTKTGNTKEKKPSRRAFSGLLRSCPGPDSATFAAMGDAGDRKAFHLGTSIPDQTDLQIVFTRPFRYNIIHIKKSSTSSLNSLDGMRKTLFFGMWAPETRGRGRFPRCPLGGPIFSSLKPGRLIWGILKAPGSWIRQPNSCRPPSGQPLQ